MGDVFTSCNWILRDGYVRVPPYILLKRFKFISAPKTATKRVFLITDEDNPHSGVGSAQLVTSARTTLIVSQRNNVGATLTVMIGSNASRGHCRALLH